MCSNSELDKEILERFEIVRKLGKGVRKQLRSSNVQAINSDSRQSHGVVWKAIDKESEETVAIKKIYDAFLNEKDSQRTFKEIMFLQELKGHENIIHLDNVFKSENGKDIYLIFEYIDSDLHSVCRANILEDVHIQYIFYQLVKGIYYMHSGDVLHRDIKTSSLLLNSDCTLKISSFGLACSVKAQENNEVENPVLSNYISNSWYKAPEVLLGSQRYTKEIEMWSIGCVLGELLGGKPIFTGTSTTNQLDCIVSVTGYPSREDIDAIDSPFATLILEDIPQPGGKGLSEILPEASKDALDLLKKLFVFNPLKRINLEDVLKHPYLATFHNPEEEISCDRVIAISAEDKQCHPTLKYHDDLYEEVKSRYQIRRKKAIGNTNSL